jgi:hypothetical protein
MHSRQRQPSTQQSSVSPVPMTVFHRLPPSSHVPLAHLVAELMEPSAHSRTRQGARP